MIKGRSINLALSVRGRKALAEVGLEQKLLDHGIPMRGRMLHDLKGNTTIVPYDPNSNQVMNCLIKILFLLLGIISICFGSFSVFILLDENI